MKRIVISYLLFLGGVRKEFFQLLTEQLFDMKFGMFLPCGAAGRNIWFNKDCTWSSQEYYLIGVLIGLAVYNGIILNTNFPKVLFKKILRHPVRLQDIKDIDDQLFSGLSQLLEYSPASDVEYVFCRSFNVEWEDTLGVKRTYDLKPNGADIYGYRCNRG